jgi:hypothetical protein
MPAARNAFGYGLSKPLFFALTIGVQTRTIGRFQYKQIAGLTGRWQGALYGTLWGAANVTGDDQRAIGAAKAKAYRASNMPGPAGVNAYTGHLGKN